MKLRIKSTGEVVDAYSIEAQNAETIKIQYFTRNGKLDHFSFNSLEELNDCLEDYKPTEPLIKDEKIRKAVRAWADVQGIKEVKYVEGITASDYKSMFIYGRFGSSQGVGNIHWGNEVPTPNLIDGETYTIPELCGEEEE